MLQRLRNLRYWLSPLASLSALGMVILSWRSSCGEQERFEIALRERGEQFERNLDHQMSQLKETIKARNDEIRRQFDKANESRYWEANLKVCSDIVTTAAKVRVSKGTDGAAKRDFKLLLYGASAMLENYQESRLRSAMMSYGGTFEGCKSEGCWNPLGSCVEAMACLCRKDLCATASEEVPSTIPGCHNPQSCSDLEEQCVSATQSHKKGRGR